MIEPYIVIAGWLVDEPALRFTNAGKAICRLRVKAKVRKEGEEPVFLTLTAWDRLAEACADTLHKGSYVLAHGALRAWSKEGEDGKRTVYHELNVADLGVIPVREAE